MNVAVVGVTGMVGREFLKVMEECNLPVDTFIPVASDRSKGTEILFRDKKWMCVTLEEALEMKPDLALFSAGGDVSLEWAPKFVEAGTLVIDNSSAWRMDPKIKLVVPEINANRLQPQDRIIANPNCSTIQLVLALHPLHKSFGIKRVIVSTYQSVTGTGKKAMDQMEAERKGEEASMIYPYRIDQNCIPHCDVFTDNGYTKEEMKLTRETKKILGDDAVLVSATAVRVPVLGGHSESVNIEFEKKVTAEEVREILRFARGINVLDDTTKNVYPMPYYSRGKNEVYVGRIREDFSHDKAVNMWIVADNLRKGAATNAVQIARYCLENNLLKS
jgi:aspartate-semialdehyde dehydrogenase